MYDVIGSRASRAFRVLWLLEEIGVEYNHLAVAPRSPEAVLYKMICSKLGFPDFVARDVRKWTHDLVNLNKHKNDLTKSLARIKPTFRRVEA